MPPPEPKASAPLSANNMDTPEHRSLYAQGLEIRKRVVGEDYVENALEKGKSDFLRPLQQFATVRFFYISFRLVTSFLLLILSSNPIHLHHIKQSRPSPSLLR